MAASRTARLIVAASDSDADLLYATRFFAPDPFVFLEKNGRTVAMFSDLEIDRARAQAKVDEIVPLSTVAQRLPRKGDLPFNDVVSEFLRQQKVRAAQVPPSFPLGLAQELGKRGVRLTVSSDLFWPEREKKSAEEIRNLRRALAITEAGMARGVEVLAASEIGRARVLFWIGARLTSERLRAEIDSAVLRAGGSPGQTIVAGGRQGCDPHERGHGVLRANELIILDVFPRDPRTGYFGDLTRTVVRGRASEAQRRMWKVALEGQKLAMRSMRPGVSGRETHESVKQHFAARGFPTEQRDSRWVGFFHGTGHGLGLDLHEEPRFGRSTFKPGQVFTVEPGLYYPEIGGVRHEDVVVVTETGIRCLSRFPKPFEV